MKLFTGMTVAAMLAMSAPVLAMAETDRPGEPEIRVRSLSGAFLAARTAEIDNDLDAAIRFYRKALAFDPANAELQRSLMLALVSSGRFDEALPLAEKLKSVPEIERFSRLALAVEAFRKQEYVEIEYLLQLALGTELDRLVTTIMQAWSLLGRDEPAGALDVLDTLEGPEWFGIFIAYHRALIADQAGMIEEALATYEDVIANREAGGTAPETYWRAVLAEKRFLARNGYREEALAGLADAEGLPPRPEFAALREQIATGSDIEPMVATPVEGAAEILLNVGSALNRGGGEAFVRLYLQFAQILRPDHDAILIQLGQVAEQQGRQEEAIELYGRVPAGSPLKRLAEMQLGLNLADVEQYEEAIRHLKALVEADPDDMRAYLALGGVYHSRKDFAAGAELYDRAVARIEEPEPAHWSIYYQRGIAYERLKQWDLAEPNFLKALELEPDQPQVLNYLGYSWVDMNMNLEQGLEMIARAVEIRPNDGYIVDSLGWAYYRLGRYEEAVIELEKAVSLRPEDPILNDHLGDAYWRVGRKLHASYQWSHARDLEPDADLLAEIERKLQNGLPEDVPEPPEKQASTEAEIQEVAELRHASPATESAAPERGYTVRPGQSLWSIAVEELGDGERMQEILQLNPDLSGDPDRIFPGQLLLLPQGAHQP